MRALVKIPLYLITNVCRFFCKRDQTAWMQGLHSVFSVYFISRVERKTGVSQMVVFPQT